MIRTLLTVVCIAVAAAVLQGCFGMAVVGAGSAALMASDRRTAGTYLEDETIEWKVVPMRDAIAGAHVNATSYNRRVLLTGEVPNEDAKKKLEAEVRTIVNVKDVVNEMQVAGASSLASRGSDSLVTSNVKARMVNNGKFSPQHVKVVTEAGVVYLMGLVSQQEGDAAVEITRNTSGVSRVVKVFEYTGK
jgi:osmotically-inducible protein OsmY